MKLAVAAPLYPPEPGGPATYAKILEEELPKRGIGVDLVKWSETKGPYGIRHVRYFLRMLRAARKADAVLALDPVSTGLPAFLAARTVRRPFFVKVVGDYAWEQGRQRYGVNESLDEFVHSARVPVPVAFFRAIQAWVTRGAAVVIVPSEYLKGIVSAWQVPSARLRVVPNAIKKEPTGAMPAAMAALSSPRVLVVGRLVPWKHFDAVIDAVAEVRESGFPISLTVIGSGPEEARLAAHAARALGDGYVFTGALPHAEVLAALDACDVFILNSSYEGLSHILIEALFAGAAIIASDAGGNRELIEDGRNGLLIPSGDSGVLASVLRRLIADSALRARLSAGARDRSADFTVERMIERTRDILSAV